MSEIKPPPDALPSPPGYPADSGKVRLLTLNSLDGRTTAAKAAAAQIAALESDAGGAERLTAAERALIESAAITGAMVQHVAASWLSGGELDVGAYTALVNAQRRLLVTLGLQRRPRDVTPDLDDYLTSRRP